MQNIYKTLNNCQNTPTMQYKVGTKYGELSWRNIKIKIILIWYIDKQLHLFHEITT